MQILSITGKSVMRASLAFALASFWPTDANSVSLSSDIMLELELGQHPM
jgi:hypothetical protein